MSEVRRAIDTVLGRPVAVKLFRGDLGPRAEKRFEREARILARLEHPNIVTVFDVGTDGDERFIVMELGEGETLRAAIDREAPLRLERACAILEWVAAALEYAHRQAVVHRDVKPSNVLLSRAGDVKLADVGVAKVLSDTGGTFTTGVFGTFGYTAPKQARGEAVDGRADVYALGCVFFEMLSGRPPFDGEGPAVLYAHANEDAPSVRSLAPSTPSEMDELIASMLAKTAADRPAAREIRERLGATPFGVRGPHVDEAHVPTVRYPPLAPTARLGSERTERIRRPPPRVLAFVVAAVAILLAGLFSVTTLVASDDDPTNRRAGSTRAAGSPARSATVSSPPTTSAATPPPSQSPARGQAARAVLSAVDDGVGAGEVTGSIAGEIRQKVEEIEREVTQEDGVERGLEKIADLRSKVAEALDKGEITSSERAGAIDHALERFAAAISRD